MFQGHSKTLDSESLVNIDVPLEDRIHSKKLKNVHELPNGVGSSSSIDLEWETAEGTQRFNKK